MSYRTSRAYTNYQPFIYRRRAKSRYSKIKFFGGLLITIILAVTVGSLIIRFTPKTPILLINPLNQALNLALPEQDRDPVLRQLITQRLQDQPGEYAIVVEALNGDKTKNFTLNDQVPFPSGSLYKLFVMAEAFQAMQRGELTMDQELAASTDHLNDVLGGVEYGYEDFQNTTISYEVSYILERIASLSDNYSAIMLAEEVGWSSVQNQADAIGTKNTIIKSPISTTASDIALFFRKLYFGEIVSREASKEIIELLAASQLNNRIPAYLPKELKIAHKTGELPQVRHDAGIVFLDNQPYLIVLMSKDLKGEDNGIELLARISEDVYKYFKQSGANQ